MPSSQYPCFDLIIQGCLNVNVNAPCETTTTTTPPPTNCVFWYVDCSPCPPVFYTDEESAFAHIAPEDCGPCVAQQIQGTNCNGCEHPTRLFSTVLGNCVPIGEIPNGYSVDEYNNLIKIVGALPNEAESLLESVTLETTCGQITVLTTGIYINGSCQFWTE